MTFEGGLRPLSTQHRFEPARDGHDADEALTDVQDSERTVEVLVLGAGVCGIGAGIALKRAGIEDFAIVDRATAVGGTWHHNRYPGCACDIPSHLYSFSFAMNPDWSRTFAGRAEIQGYLERLSTDAGLGPHLELATEVRRASWDESAAHWRVETSRGRFAARFFIVAAGPLHEPIIPRIPGLADFIGAAFHSSAWPADLDLAGKRIAVIGTGASAIQFVPRIQAVADRVSVFQRTPPWVMPKIDWSTTRAERWAMRRVPGLIRVARLAQWVPIDGLVLLTHHPRAARAAQLVARAHMRRAIADADLRRSLTPDYVLSCKRVAISNEYYRAFAQPNVELITEPAAEIREHSIVGADGTARDVDVIVFGTGFHVLTTHPIAERIIGTDETLAAYWRGQPRGYMGCSIPGFPNLFMMFGPNIGTASGFVMAEAQLDYVTRALRYVRGSDVASIDVTEAAQRDFTERVDRALDGSTFVTGGCTSYYLDEAGRAALAWPWTMARMRRELGAFDPTAYRMRRAATIDA